MSHNIVEGKKGGNTANIKKAKSIYNPCQQKERKKPCKQNNC